MKLFLSWSRPQSRSVAEALRVWLPQVIQAVQPWISSEDIDKGARWSTSVANELAEARVGIICLTKENLSSAWILFEAGALSKALDKSLVCPYLYDLKPTEVTGPLSQFQLSVASREDTFRLVETINQALGERKLPGAVLESAFETWWPKLEEALRGIRPSAPEVKPRGLPDLLEETLGIVRQLSRDVSDLKAGGAIPISETFNRKESGVGSHARGKSVDITRTNEKVGRNDPCPCGSGEVYKKCCGAVSARAAT